MTKLTKYRVTIHEHIINDLWVRAKDENEARNIAKEQISNGGHTWLVDENAGWIEVGDILSENELNTLEI